MAKRDPEKRREQNRRAAAEARRTRPEARRTANRAYYHRNKEKERARAKKYLLDNKEKVQAAKRRGAFKAYLTAIRNRHGLTAAAYFALLGEQNGLCRICRGTNDGAALHVDHKHVDGYDEMPPMLRATYVRGLLCYRCNSGLGYFRDRPDLLVAAAHYLGGPHG